MEKLLCDLAGGLWVRSTGQPLRAERCPRLPAAAEAQPAPHPRVISTACPIAASIPRHRARPHLPLAFPPAGGFSSQLVAQLSPQWPIK